MGTGGCSEIPWVSVPGAGTPQQLLCSFAGVGAAPLQHQPRQHVECAGAGRVQVAPLQDTQPVLGRAGSVPGWQTVPKGSR